MPFPLLIALFLAFGFEAPDPGRPWPAGDAAQGAIEAAAAVLAVGVVAFVLGRRVAAKAVRVGPEAARSSLATAGRVVDALAVGAFAWVLYDLRWPALVRSGFGLGGMVLVDEVLILLPFLAAQVIGWWGLHRGEAAIRATSPATATRRPVGLGRHLTIRARQTMGMVLPMALIFALGQDLAARLWPTWSAGAWGQLTLLAAMGGAVLALAPAFVRLAWPTRRLPAGPLRERLERLSARLGFRYTDILVWDTDGVLVNAGVTGTLPWFRYVLLSDALIERLEPREVAAVFGHEMGHVAHRHLVYLGFFLLGSLGVMVVAGDGVDRWLAAGPGWGGPATWPWSDPIAGALASAGVALVLVGLYVLVVFGYLSRRFERQADVFGCRSVSCGLADCPPHADLDAPGRAGTGATPGWPRLCPVGIRIFVNALERVAALNGLRREARSWRHGSIARRIAFLEGLEGRPEVERRFQRGVLGLRLGLALALLAAVAVAFAAGTAGAGL